MDDFNIDWKDKINPNLCDFSRFCDTCSMSNQIKDYTCLTKTQKSIIDLILTNKEHSFQLTKATDGEKGGVSDVHLLLPIFMKSETTRLPPKQVMYRDFKNFNEKVFLDDVKLNNFSRKSDDSSENYEFLSYQFQSVINKHAPFKTEIVRGNNAPFANKTLRKEIRRRSALRNKFFKDSSDSNWQKYPKQKSNFVKIRKKCIKEHFKSITKHDIMTKRKFWATIRPFLTNKENVTSKEILLKQVDDVINSEGKFFSHVYINVVENTAGKKPLSVLDKDDVTFSTVY